MTDTVTLYRTDDGWRWRYEASGRVLADSGQGYSRRIDAVKGACRVVGADVLHQARVITQLRDFGQAVLGRSYTAHAPFIRFVIEATR